MIIIHGNFDRFLILYELNKALLVSILKNSCHILAIKKVSIHQVQARRNREIDISQSGQSNNLQAGVPTWPLVSNAIAESIAMSQSETLPPSVNMRRIAVNFIGYGVLEYLFPHRKQENRRVIDDEMVAPALQLFSLPPSLSHTLFRWHTDHSCSAVRLIDQSTNRVCN